MNNKVARCFNAHQFQWDGKRGYAFASDLGLKPGEHACMRYWNDSCDIGFDVHSSVTGTTLAFLLEPGHGLRGHYVFRSNLRKDIQITIFND